MKRIVSALLCVFLLAGMLFGCGAAPQTDIAATTLPVYEFTRALCAGTPLQVTRLVTQEVSCLHDYTLNVDQVKAAEAARVVVVSGAGLEDFLSGVIAWEKTIDASAGIELIHSEEGHSHEHGQEDASHADGDNGHSHEQDPHIWLDPENAMTMAENICIGLCARYPEYKDIFTRNLSTLLEELEALLTYGKNTLATLSCRELITFHDGFAYFAQAFDLTILEAVEEESGSEASARELIHLIEETRHHNLPAVFTETNGSVSAAEVISRETGAGIFRLDMIMSGNSYFDAMKRNIDTIKEALG